MPVINGMWQLKTIEDAGSHTIQSVDTIFYAFQRQSIFSYTILHEKEDQPASFQVVYGFIDFIPDNDHLRIQIDKNHYINDKGEKYYINLNLLLWKSEEITYTIVRLDSKCMILSQGGSIYNFKKY
jgi:hypothetical protein